MILYDIQKKSIFISERNYEISLKADGELIYFVENPSKRSQTIAVTQNPYSIQHISNPDDDVIELSLKISNGKTFKLINKPK